MNEYVNKLVLSNGDVPFDISGDDVTPDKVSSGVTFHDASGAPRVGTSTFDVDSSEVTATAAEVLKDKTFAKGGKILTGTMPNNGAQNIEISKAADAVVIKQGYHDGAGKAGLSASEKAKLIPENIRDGVTLLGITGTMSGSEDVVAQSKEVTPSFEQQEIIPDEGYNSLTAVVVNAIPMSYTDNAAGGKTLTIG